MILDDDVIVIGACRRERYGGSVSGERYRFRSSMNSSNRRGALRGDRYEDSVTDFTQKYSREACRKSVTVFAQIIPNHDQA